MQTPIAQFIDVQIRLEEAFEQLRTQQGLTTKINCSQTRATIAMLLSNGLRVCGWLETQHNRLLDGIGEFRPAHYRRKE